MRFQLTNIPATLTSLTCRTEKSGPEDLPAISAGLKITTANTILDVLDPTLRHTLYKAADGQPQLDGVEEVTPLLRSRDIGALALDKKLEGWTVIIEHGIDETSAVVLGQVKLDEFKVNPHEGGSVDLAFRIGTAALTRNEVGLLWEKQRKGVVITVQPPEPKAEAIDGTQAAFERDTQGDLLGEPDATAAFLAGAEG